MIDGLQAFRDNMKTILADQHEQYRNVVNGLPPDALNWRPGNETNSIAVLVVHSMGAEHSLLTTALGDPIPRDRDAEFRAMAQDAEEMLAVLDKMDKVMPDLVDRLTEEDLSEIRTRPNDRLGREAQGMWWLLHAVEHNCEHIGHASLTRQMYEQRVS